MMKEKNGIQYYFDYTACLFPEGLMSDEVIFVNEEDIADIIFLGYDDTDSEQINKRIIEWQNESNVKKGSMAIFVDEE
ncbi:DUF4176 domain-containing protein [Paenilisteria weihenstephanensis]|nr:DUF4176 domain-containing protein [Listeria weihenstephanensis]